MEPYEYKTVSLAYGLEFFKESEPDLETMLNRGAKEGWRLEAILVPGKELLEAQKITVILERKITS